MLPFFATLGIGKDENNFNMNNILEENFNRKYRVTQIDPMNSNIAFVLYSCSANQNLPPYTLRAFSNENLVKVDGCDSVNCDLDQFLSFYGEFKNRCISTRDVCKI
jgi:hypothetical protein